MHQEILLNKNWQFKLINYPLSKVALPKEKISKWIPAEVPGTIHTDLLKAGLIDDPFKENNEYKLEWISESNCIYKTEFDFPDKLKNSSAVKLVFEGIDTVADIYLNGKCIGKSENMFLRYEFNVTRLLKSGKNILELRFKSPVTCAKKLEKKYGELSAALNSYRVHIRKAQYSFGWDWGPSYPTMGIWRSVYLLAEDKAAIQKIYFRTEKLTKNNAVVKVSFDVVGNYVRRSKAVVSLSYKDKQFNKEILIRNNGKCEAEFTITNPKLWYPNGEGDQNLYDLKISIFDVSGKVLDEKIKRVGIRRIELQLKDKNKATFRFKINKKPVYIKGMNWIPADSFLPRVNKKKYRKLLTLAKNANANMIRVWGGGIYENDEFYDLCDEHGLLVWQDFMFACAAYPESKQFLISVAEEIIQNVERLRNHPCIAIWCGNNENEWGWYREEQKSYKEMPGYKIFENLIPGLLKTLDSTRPYWQTSPFGFDEDPNSQRTGNRHQWDIWSFWIDYNEVKSDRSLFVTEFGFQGPANELTFNKILPKEKRKIQSSSFEYYNKQIEGPERVIRFLSGHLPIKTNWSDFIYLAQLNQGLALKTCIEHWRTNKITNGSIIWQVNDCWPVTSWSLIDSASTPKISYYFTKNVFSKSILYFEKSKSHLKINLLNGRGKDKATLETIVIDSASGKYLSRNSQNVSLDQQKYIELNKINLADLPEDKNWIIVTTLYDRNKNIIHRNYFIEKEWKHLKLPKATIKIRQSKTEANRSLILTTNRPAFFVDVHYPGITFSDRGFILIPGEAKRLETSKAKNKAIKKNNIKIFSLNDYLNN